MSILDSVKKIAADVLSQDTKDSISDSVQQLSASFIKNQIKSGNLNQIITVINEIIGEKGSIGGLSNLVSKFQAVNLGDLIQSWIGNGKNFPFSLDQVKTVFGQEWLEQLAQKIGIDTSIVTGLISHFLPTVVDKASDEVNIESNKDSKQINVAEILSSIIK